VLKVFALIGNVPVRFLQQQDCLMTALRFLILATCYFALRTAKFRLCCFIVAILDAGAVRQGGEGFQPYIDADVVAAVRQPGWFILDRETCVPAPRFAAT